MYARDESYVRNTLEKDILPALPKKLSSILTKISDEDISSIEEIRLRAERPFMVYKKGQDMFLNEDGVLSFLLSRPVIVERQDIEKTLTLMSNYSIYSIEEELKQGFLTLKGGHRVGLTGRIVMEDRNIRTMKNISGMNIRIAKEIKGCGNKIIKEIYGEGIKHTLIASPPGCGKTTMLRDIIRVLSSGDRDFNIKGFKIGLVDERSEIAGCYLGVPQRDVGIRTDVLDACPKAQGMFMLLRSMSPEIIAVDEIGSVEDAEAIEDAINSGVKIIATVHGRNFNEIQKRQGVKILIENKAFERIVILSRRSGPGTIEEIIKI
ncbi:stage III sporulation protein AA [Fervidicella metallireducens AeB]|uniref:Stage III sporulation protein AA n=1 Tax=Fervidicella metallireducens AeB TaxID=1403537 RepID=A0A017RYN6_9CLOT|nr:stage III sporulation protein AA [Fervidicella metallireducens]EYE89691.1 stage III sporulation protein AA [Fervidicella metallireducens AeB]